MGTSSVGGPLPTEARQGRHKQKYGQSGERLLAGCIPFRLSDEESGKHEVEVLLVTRRNGGGWIFPKGGWESDEDSVESAALRETVEEAGVRGALDGPILGVFEFKSKKRQHFSPNLCQAHVFAMRVIEQLDSWPEQTWRKRRWFSLAEAYNLCVEDWMRNALWKWIDRNDWASLITNGTESSLQFSQTTTSDDSR